MNRIKMKLKNPLRNDKGEITIYTCFFIVAIVMLISFLLLAVCVIWNTSGQSEFSPDPAQAAAPIDSWTENSKPDYVSVPPEWKDTSGNAQAGQPAGENVTDPGLEYPKTITDTEDEVVINFTDPNPFKEPPPETIPDESNADTGEVPTQQPISTDPPAVTPSAPQSSTPAPGSTNSSGEFYDPVFGWVKPGNVVVIDIDSDGDPDKMVGNMR